MKWDGWNELTSPGSFIEELHSSNYAAVGYEFSARAHHISSPLTSFPLEQLKKDNQTYFFSSIKLNGAKRKWKEIKDWLNWAVLCGRGASGS